MVSGEELIEFAKGKIALILFFAILYATVFVASKEFGLANAIKTTGAIIYLPAGVRLLACLVGRFWGALGIFAATCFFVAPNVFPNESSSFHFAIAFINTTSVLISVLLTLKFFKISLLLIPALKFLISKIGAFKFITRHFLLILNLINDLLLKQILKVIL